MEPTYTVLGADGNQYGPVNAEQMRGWLREGRIANETQVWRSDRADWVSAATFPEFAGINQVASAPLPVGAPAPIHVQAPTAADPELARRVKSGAGWFYWIAAFSIINSVMMATGSGWGFALGLGVTQLIDAMASNAAGGAKAVALVLNGLAAGLLVLFGFFAGKGQAWAFIVGMIVLALDTAVAGLLQMWLSLALHLFALFCIFAGFRASRAMRGN